jgi:integrase
LRQILNLAVRKKLLPSNPCAGVEFPVRVKGLFRPHYMGWTEQQLIELQAPNYLRNIIRIITETGLRVYKELMPMKKDQVDLDNAVVWIPDSKTPQRRSGSSPYRTRRRGVPGAVRSCGQQSLAVPQ